jgi:class 3 adenylate cyclase/tetratricopeptide (TPR) repeat protein
MHCPACKSVNPGSKKFCGKCGAKFATRCPKCGGENPPDDKFCGDCGTALTTSLGVAGPSSPRLDRERDAAMLEGERKTVSPLFADIKGSMELIEDLDPEDARAIVDPALALMMDAVHRYDGYVAQSTGDGIFALFGAPVAYEDHAQRALYAALRMQEDLRRYSDKLRKQGRAPVIIRVGVNTGEVVVRTIKTDETHSEYTPIGHSTSLASRLQSLAGPGSIAISEPVRKLVEGYFTLNPLGPARIKGVSHPVNVYEVTGLGPIRTRLQRSANRGYTSFVGRQKEMSALQHAAEEARAGHGQVVSVMAEAGVGKSRLFHEFKLTSQSGFMVLETFSVSHGKASAYLPVLDLLWSYFGITSEDDHRTRREKVTGRVMALDPGIEDILPYLFGLLGIVESDDPHAQMDAQVRKRRTLNAIKRLLLRESLNQPLMMIFEDLQWIDAETQELFDLIADSIGAAKILMIVNYRPEYSHQWSSKTHYTYLRLDPLGKASAGEMLSALLGDGDELAALKRLIIERTEGTPFFMEETVQVLLDEGSLVRNGTVKLTRPLAELKIPPTVQAILASRIDRLPADAKDLLQTLAVIGREFTLSLVRAAVGHSDDELDRLLNDLQLSEFIYEQPAVGDAEYTFKHSLTQEVAYNSVLMERRKQLHDRIGTALETLYETSLDDHLAELAHHFGRGNNSEKAVDYLGRAAQQAASRSALGEALAYARAGLAIVPTLAATAERGRLEFGLLSTLVRGAIAIEGWGSPQTTQGCQRMLELARESSDDIALFTALQGMWLDHHIAARYREGAEIARQMIELAERRKSPTALADASFLQGLTLYFTNYLGDALTAFNRAIALCPDGAGRNSYDGSDPLAGTLTFAALSTCVLGYPDRAINLFECAIKRCRELNQPFSLGYVLFHQTWIFAARGDVTGTQRVCQQLEAVAEEGGFTSFSGLNRIYQGWVASMKGEHEQGIAMIRCGIASWANPLFTTVVNSILAEACLRAGRYQSAIDAVAAGRKHSLRTGEHYGESELERVAGETLIKMGAQNAAEAEQCIRRAIVLAAEQGAKWFELRATTSLARLLAQQGKCDHARTMLADLYGWFTEGFETVDLKDAKTLLGELITLERRLTHEKAYALTS